MRAFTVLLVISLGFTGLTLRALRRKELREQMAVLWIMVSVAMLALTCTMPFHLLDHLARLLGIAYGSDLVFLLAMVFLVVLVFQLSLALTRLNVRTTRLVQELSLLTSLDESSTGPSADSEAIPSLPCRIPTGRPPSPS